MHKIDEIKAVFTIDANDASQSEEICGFIKSFSRLIAERFYNNYLLHEEHFIGYLSQGDIPRLISMFTNYFERLFCAPLDEEFIEITRKVAAVHQSLQIQPLLMSKAFLILQEIIIDLAMVNKVVEKHLKTLLKHIKIAEYIMSESTQTMQEQSFSKVPSNEVLMLFDTFYTLLHRIKSEKISEEIESLIHTLYEEKSLCSKLGFDVDELQGMYDSFKERNDEEIIERISARLEHPLFDLSTTSFLAIHSSFSLLQASTKMLGEKDFSVQSSDLFLMLVNALHQNLTATFGWCIERYEVGEEELSTVFDILYTYRINKQRLYVGIQLREIPNEIYMKETIRTLLEMIKISYLNKEREFVLIKMADAAESANKSKDIFLANMSHELRTPLNAIIGFSQLLSANKTVPENLKKYIDKINISGNNLLELVNTILDFAKLEAGKMDYKPKYHEIKRLFNEVYSLTESQAKAKNLTFEYPKLISLELYFDYQLIKQVLLNLISNAIKFTPKDGVIAIFIAYDSSAKAYTFGIKDNGIGIEKSQKEKLFNPFTQLENPFQKEHKGTGLGLSISKKIIEVLHNGKIWVESIEGEGSCFYFTIPIVSDNKKLEEHTVDGKEVLFILEDSMEYQQLICEKLEGAYSLVVCNSIELAKEYLQENTVQMILADYFLIDGISAELIEVLYEEGYRTPVIIISSEDDSQIKIEQSKKEYVLGTFSKNELDDALALLHTTMKDEKS